MNIEDMPVIEIPQAFIDDLLKVTTEPCLRTEDSQGNVYWTLKGWRMKSNDQSSSLSY